MDAKIANRLKEISVELAKIAGKLDVKAKKENDDAWQAFYASCDVKAAASRLYFAQRQLRQKTPKAKESK